MEIKAEEKIERPPIWGSCRMVITILAFFGNIFIYILRLNFGIAIVCMTGTSVNSTEGGAQSIEGEFDWDDDTVALLLGAFFYSYMFTQIPGGFLSDKFGEKYALIGGMLFNAIFVLLSPVMARLHWGALFTMRLLQGLVSGVLLPVVYNLFTTWTSPVEKATLMSAAFAGVPIANIINYPVSALLCFTDIDGGWPMVFYVPGSLAIIWCIIFFFLAANSPEEHPRISEKEKLYLRHNSCRNLMATKINSEKKKLPLKEIFLSPCFYGIMAPHFAQAWLFYLLALNIPLFVDQVYNAGIVENGLICAIPYIPYAILALTTGKLFDALNKRNYVSSTILRKFFNTLGGILAIFAVCFMSVWTTPVGQLVLLSIAACTLQICGTCGFFTSHAEVAGPFSGFFFAATNTVANTSGFIGPLIVAAVAPNGTQQEWYYVFYIGAGVMGFGTIIYLVLGTAKRQSWACDDSDEAKVTTEVKSINLDLGSIASLSRRTSLAL